MPATAVRDVTRHAPGVPQPTAAPDSRPPQKKQRRGGPPTPHGEKRDREADAPASRRPTGRSSLKNKKNIESLFSINGRFPGSVRVRLSDGAAPLDMIAAARRAARRANTDTLVFSERTPTGRAVSLWDELRTWDPGD